MRNVWWPSWGGLNGHFVIVIDWRDSIATRSHSLILPRLVLTPLPEDDAEESNGK
jgi:hypothetical protein